jgi:hypothetical protein
MCAWNIGRTQFKIVGVCVTLVCCVCIIMSLEGIITGAQCENT